MSQKSILSFFKQTDKSLQNKSDDNQKSTPKRNSSSDKTSSAVSPKLSEPKQKEGSSTNGSIDSPKLKEKSQQNKNNGSDTNGEIETSSRKKKIQQNESDSPIKQTRKRKVRAIIESDDDSNHSQNEVSKHEEENEKMDTDCDSEVKESLKNDDESTNPSVKQNGVTSTNKRKNVDSEDNSACETSKKIKLNGDSSKENKDESETKTSNSQPSTSAELDNGNDQTLPAKRKTARKTFSKKKVEKTSSKSEESKNSDQESQSSDSPVSETEENGKKETELKSEDKDAESKENTKKTTSPKKIEAIHPFFAPKNKKEKSSQDETTSKDKNTSGDESSLASKKNTKNSDDKKSKRKSSPKSKKGKAKTESAADKDNSINENSENDVVEDKSSSENESSPTASKKGRKKKGDSKPKIPKVDKSKKPKSKNSKTTNESEKLTESDDEADTKGKSDSDVEAVKQGESDSDVESPAEKTKDDLKDKNKSEISNSIQDKEDPPSAKKKLNTSSASSGVVYDPAKSKYHPIDDACWKQNEKVPYLALAKTLDLIENTSARLKIVEILSNYLRSVIVLTPEDLLQSVYLCLNRIAPEYEGIELGVGDMVLMKAVAQATGRTLDKIRAELKEKGDLGLIAESSRGNQKVMFAPPKLTVASVFSKFKEIAKMSGNAAMAKKTDKIQALFVACRDCEAKFIIRSLSGKLRIGLAEQSVLAALGRAVVMTPPGQSFPPEIMDKSSGMSSEKFKKLQDEKTLILKTTYCECPNYDLVIPVLLKEGIDRLPEHCQLSPGCPLKPMLAHPTAGIDEVLQRFDNNEFTCEFKYDGERAQIHRTDKGEIRIFSRNQEDNTSKYPDIIARLSKALKDTTESFILDTEAVAWDKENEQILPFQILSTRKKKDAVESEIKVQVCVMAFDLLYLNGESLVKKPLKERRELLHSSFVEVQNEFMFVTYKDGNSAETMQEFLDESIKGNCEGLMVKALKVDASYEIAKRSHNWLKLKKDYLEGVGDTLDLVVIGGYHGKGKRTGTYGGFLLACYDNENEEFQSICKLGTGFKEDELEAHTKFLKNHVIAAPKSYYRYDHSLEPDEWFEAEQIWEVKCADLSISPIHKAGIGIVDPEKGISLRFPRFLRIRDDKKVEEATSASQIADMYQRQDQVQNMKAKPKNEEDYY